MAPTRCSHLLLIAGLAMAAMPVKAKDIDALPVTVTFVVSTGFWEESGETVADESPASSAVVEPAPSATPAEPKTARRGYYKLVAERQPDRTAKVYLQQVAATDDGPVLVNSVELEEFSAMRPYVTDIRPEDSSGVSRQPGLFATVYLKTDPATLEPEGWTVLIDEFGDIKVEKQSN
ncbi:MAG: hypothetical protein ACOH2J_22260 [Allorhizobium sp.]